MGTETKTVGVQLRIFVAVAFTAITFSFGIVNKTDAQTIMYYNTPKGMVVALPNTRPFYAWVAYYGYRGAGFYYWPAYHSAPYYCSDRNVFNYYGSVISGHFSGTFEQFNERNVATTAGQKTAPANNGGITYRYTPQALQQREDQYYQQKVVPVLGAIMLIGIAIGFMFVFWKVITGDRSKDISSRWSRSSSSSDYSSTDRAGSSSGYVKPSKEADANGNQPSSIYYGLSRDEHGRYSSDPHYGHDHGIYDDHH